MHGKKWLHSIKKKQIVEKRELSFPIVENKQFVIIIPSYNNEKWVEKNLRSVLEQDYSDFRVIYIDDASLDQTYATVSEWLSRLPRANCVELRRNQKNLGAAENYYRAILSCAPHEIVLMLDGDDWLAHEGVLQKLNGIYANPDVWMTFGNYLEYPSYSYTIGKYSRNVPAEVVKKNSIRQYVKTVFPLSHLKTFYAGLFHKIKQEDLMLDGKFLDASSDQAIIIPVFEMAGVHHQYVRDILYIYNRSTPFNDDKLRADRQLYCSRQVCARPPYQPLKELKVR